MKKTLHIAPLLLIGITLSTALAVTTTFVVDPNNTIPNTVANLLLADGQGVDWNTDALLIELDAGSVYNSAEFDSNMEQSGVLWDLFPELQWDSFVGAPGLTPELIFKSGDNPCAIDVWDFMVDTYPPDLDGDNSYSIRDWHVILDNWAQSVPPGTLGDVDGDGFVGASDLGIMLSDWGPGPDEGLLLADNVPQLVSAAWGNIESTDTGPINTATITLSDDAQGGWARLTSFRGDPDDPALQISALGNIIDGVLEPTPILGDYDDSGMVGAGDQFLVVDNWGPNDPLSPEWINERPVDGFVGAAQQAGILCNWGNVYTGPPPSVPEPAGLGVMALAATVGFVRRRRR